MECPKCNTEIVIRNGKFGEFLCCPRGHGTFSIQSGMMYFKGEVGTMLKNQKIDEVYSRLQLEYIETGVRNQPTLSQLMSAQLARWGWNSGGEMEQLAEFAVGNPDEMWDQDEKDDPDMWWNARMY